MEALELRPGGSVVIALLLEPLMNARLDAKGTLKWPATIVMLLLFPVQYAPAVITTSVPVTLSNEFNDRLLAVEFAEDEEIAGPSGMELRFEFPNPIRL